MQGVFERKVKLWLFLFWFLKKMNEDAMYGPKSQSLLNLLVLL